MNNKTIEQKIQRTEKEIARLEYQKKIKQHEAKQLERNCRAKYYRQEAAKERSREIACAGCGKTFTTTRVDVKYCCEECRLETKKRDMAESRAASKEQGTA